VLAYSTGADLCTNAKKYFRDYNEAWFFGTKYSPEAGRHLSEVFAEERSNLEKQWDRGDNVSTEDLRVAFQRYRTFFDRLLSV
jgi:hypothetical protein